MYKSHLFLKFQVLHKESSFTASFVEHPVYSISKMYSIPILAFWFWFATVYPKSMYKSNLFLKFQVLRKWSSFIASFVGHPVCSNFRMYSVLILVFFYFNVLQLIQSACVKVNFSWNFRCSAKEAVILLLSWSTLYIVFPKCIVSWI